MRQGTACVLNDWDTFRESALRIKPFYSGMGHQEGHNWDRNVQSVRTVDPSVKD